MNKTRKKWRNFNPYFQGSQRSSTAPVVIQMKEDIEELYMKLAALRAKLRKKNNG